MGMSREEAIVVLKNEQPHCGKKALFPEEKKYEAFDMAIKALEQEPCEDMISRHAVLEMTYDMSDIDGEHFTEPHMVVDVEDIQKLPSITPQPKMGHWIETAEEYYKAINEEGGGVNENTPYFTDDIACSECLSKFSVIDNETERFICCPNCGTNMEGDKR